MKNILILMLILAVLLGGYPVMAQQTNNDGDVYVVQPGDSAWRIAGKVMDDPTLWEEVVKKTPFLKEKGRISRDPKTGWVMVMMHPGEQLFGLRELGIIDTPGGSTFLPLEVTTARWSKADFERMFWLMISLILLLLLIFWYVFLRSRRDLVSSGPAIVPGGVAPEQASARFQEMAARMHGGNFWNLKLSAQNFQIISSQAGRIWGVLNVRYADEQEIPRRLNGDRAYRAQVRFPNGKTETLYMLQGCGNDLRYGGISRYIPGPEFRFEADPEPVVAPPPIVPAQPAQPVVPQGPVTVAGIQPTGEFVREKDAPSVPVSPETVSPGKPKVLRSFRELPAQSGMPAAFVFTGGVVGYEELEDGTITVRVRNNK